MNDDYSDLLEEMMELTEDEISLKDLSEELEVSQEKAMGLVGLLKNTGVNFVIVAKDDGIYLINQGDKNYRRDYTYSFSTDENHKKKFLVISDLRMGSIFAQPSILNEVYLKAYNQGVRDVLIAGNITEGLYKITSNNIYTLIVKDTMSQAKYVVDNFPYIEGMTTYFITGKKDHTHLVANKMDIGKQISLGREDLNYIGNTRCNINIDNTSLFLINRTQRKTYTQSYRAQKLIDAMRSEDKPDIILYGGLLQSEKFTYRDVKVMSIPSMCASTWEMEEKEYANTVGAWVMEIETDKHGKFVKCSAYDDIYYTTFDNDYERARVLKKGGIN